jgi:SAM-dependent methyltransferase
MSGVIDRLLPPDSQRRVLARVLAQAGRSPGTLARRLNPENLALWLRYRNHRFHCPVCGEETTPLYDFPDLRLRREHRIGVLRETLQCRRCLASMRHRSLVLALLDELGRRWGARPRSVAEVAATGLRGLAVLDSDDFSATSRRLREIPGYVRCSYVPGAPWGAPLPGGALNVDLQRMPFPDARFDVVLSSDVMEHVRDARAAHAEIRRVLRPGGAYVFNVPFEESSAENIRLVDTSTEVDRHLVPPQLHGDPLSGGVLAYRVFGREILSELRELGFRVEFHRLRQPSALVVDGDVFVAHAPEGPP